MAVAPSGPGKLPATGLKDDTKQAAAGSPVEGMSYVGVWAENAADCATVDQPNPARYVVITGSTVRLDAEACAVSAVEITGGTGKLTFNCPLSGGTATVDISMPTPDNLVFNNSPPLVRCQP